MAEAGRPGAELHPPGGGVSVESTLFDMSKAQGVTPPRLAGSPGITSKELQLSGSLTKQTNCNSLRVGGQEQSQSECCVPPKVSHHSHRLAEMQTPSHPHNTVVNDNPQAGGMLQTIKPASLPVHRSHSETLPLGSQGLAPQDQVSHTCGLAHHGGETSIQEAENHSMFACKQPMPLQQCSIITTVCRSATSGEGDTQQPQTSCVCVQSPKVAAKPEKSPQCDKALCYVPYNHHVHFEDSFAAYCHPQPIPATLQLLPRPPGAKTDCDLGRAVAPAPAPTHLTLPRLISSVSETGLDAKHLLRCCNLNCSWISLQPPVAGPQCSTQGCRSPLRSPVSHVRTITRDTGTMTAHKELRDVGVQTGQIVTPHVFPQICLADENRSETSCKKPGGATKSPVKEVKWDAEGMTWEVYGASVDPEELGLAIQKHLELQIKETASHAAKVACQTTNASRQGGDAGRHRKRSRMMGSFRTPTCCTRSTTAVD